MTIVNTVNTEGIMGAGLALEFRIRYPDMFLRYRELCETGLFEIGQLWIYKSHNKWILNFPTKNRWRLSSRLDYIRLGLNKFCETYQAKGITSVAFPLLGADKGKLNREIVLDLMCNYLAKCNIEVEIYQGSVNEADADLLSFLEIIMENALVSKSLSNRDKLIANKICDFAVSEAVYCFSDLLKIKGLSVEALIRIKRILAGIHA